VFKQTGNNDYHGFGVILIDLKKHEVIKRLAESAELVNGGAPQFLYIPEKDTSFYGWSPTSKEFAFIGTYEGKSGLFLIDIGDSSVNLLYESSKLQYFKWSPSGTKILFFENVGNSNSKFNLYVINSDGTHLTKITEDPELFQSIHSTWGNDDDTIFIDEGVMKAMNLDTVKFTGETRTGPPSEGLVSPDHKYYISPMRSGKNLSLVLQRKVMSKSR